MKHGDTVKYARVPLVEDSVWAEELSGLRGTVAGFDRTEHLTIKDWVGVQWDESSLGTLLRKFTAAKEVSWVPADMLEVVSE